MMDDFSEPYVYEREISYCNRNFACTRYRRGPQCPRASGRQAEAARSRPHRHSQRPDLVQRLQRERGPDQVQVGEDGAGSAGRAQLEGDRPAGDDVLQAGDGGVQVVRAAEPRRKFYTKVGAAAVHQLP
jgi:hypothetical protein